MFTGIVQAVGTVRVAGRRLVVEVAGLPYEPPEGGSVAIDGVCLTRVCLPPPTAGGDASQTREGRLAFDLSHETLARTTLGALGEGSKVNVEAALRAGDPIGGHFVMGHVDGVGEFLGSSGEEFRFRAPDGGERFLVDKGSITLAGVSLTVVRPEGRDLWVALIPQTLRETTLSELQPGGSVNVEYDALARYLNAE
jgi:riboflavin synthase